VKSKFIADEGGRTLAVIFDKGEEVAAGLLKIAQEHNLTAASFTAISALSNVTLGYFDRDRKDYKKIPIKEQVEALALTGNIAPSDGRMRATIAAPIASCWPGIVLARRTDVWKSSV
jgi:uncharacterized protein